MLVTSTRSGAGLLVCLALFGCGGRPSPAEPVAGHDSAVPATGPALPASVPGAGVAVAGTPVPAGSPPVAPAAESIPAIISRAFPGARSVQSLSEPFPHRAVRDSSGAVLGYEVFSDSAGVTARGYGGPVPVQVLFDAQGRPVRIYVLDNRETPAYMDRVLCAGVLDSLLECDPTKPESVDAVTLATTSSRAIIYGVTGLIARVAAEVVAKPGSRVR